MKKIALYCDSMNNGGTEKATLDLVNNLPEDKYDITVIQLIPGGKYQKQFHKNIKNKTILPALAETNFRFYWWSRRLFEKIPLSLAHKLIFGNKYDIEIGCGYGYPTKIVAKSKKAKSISWIHMDVSLDKNYVSTLTKEEGREYFKGIDEFVCVSNDCAKKFNDKFGYDEITTVAYNIVSEKEIRKRADEKCNIILEKGAVNILAIGRLTWQKGFDMLINAACPVIKNNKNVHLYIIGDGEDSEKLSQQIKWLELENNVHMLGHIDNHYPIFKQTDVYVCSSRHESFSLTVAESLILERPTISTKCTGPIELLENGKYGILVEADEIELKKAIELMVSNYEEREYYSKRAKERIEFFDIDRSIKKWEEILDR